jgi:cardiolipin synthase
MDLVLFHTTLVIASLGFLFVAMATRRQHRSPQSAFAWLLFTALLPYLAVPAFLALGNRKTLPSARLVRFGQEKVPENLAPFSVALNRLSAHSGLPAVSEGNAIDFISDGKQAHAALSGMIASARRSIDIVFYKFGADDVARDFIARLAEQARKGIRVRLLLDGYGSRNRPRRELRALEEAGAMVRIFAPLVANPVRGHINLRNHRKMVIADTEQVFAGGMNIGREYLGDGDDDSRWADLAYVARGPVLADFERLFLSDWARAGNEPVVFPPAPQPQAAGTSVVQLLPSGPDIAEDVLHDAIVMGCHRAQRRITVVTPYFLPSSAIAGALSVAVRRGVPVTLIIPEVSNQRLADLARASFLREMADSGIAVLAHPGMVHAKAIIIDDCSFAGSANLDIRSLYINFEAMLVLHSESDTARLAEWVDRLARQTRRWRPDQGIFRRVSEIVFRLAAPLM